MSNNLLQSNEWRKFQEAVGHKTFNVSDETFSASIVEHNLPVVGKYFYIPHGPVICHPELVSGSNDEMLKQVQHDMEKLIELAKKEKAGWIRVEPADSHTLDLIGKNLRVVKAPHDMQPKETLIIDISKSEEEILAGMKSKTRYNIKLAEKKGVNVRAITKEQKTRNKQISNSENNKYLEEFLRLTKIVSERQGIKTHSDEYYRKMFEIIPSDILKLYVAEYDGKIIAANVIVFYGDTAYYLHGASDDKYKNLMAPHLLQWRQIQDARKAGCKKYDFWGISTNYESRTNIRITNKWKGITRFKLGFSPNTKPVIFPGSYDIIIDRKKYFLYLFLQRVKNFFSWKGRKYLDSKKADEKNKD